MANEQIKINELAEGNISLSDFIAKAGASGIATKITLQKLADVITSASDSQFKGALAIADTPSANGWYFPSESGTYTNAGDIVVSLTNKLNIIIVSGTQDAFDLLVIPISVAVTSDVIENSLEAISSGGVFNALQKKASLSVGKNKFTQKDIVTGYYRRWNDGELKESSSFSYVLLAVKPDTQYTWSNNGEPSDLPQFAFFNADVEYVSGNSAAGDRSSITFTTAASVEFVALNLKNDTLNYLYMLEEGSTRTSYQEYSYKLDVEEIRKGQLTKGYLHPDLARALPTVRELIEIDINGGKDFTSIRSAIDSVNDSSFYNQYEFYLHEGEYDVLSDYTDSEIREAGFKGLWLEDGMSITGIGNRDNIHIKGILDPATYDSGIRNLVSTINFRHSGNLTNLYVSADEIRYAVHDDVGTDKFDTQRRVVGNKFYHFAGGGFTQAYGEGTRSGSNHFFENNHFETEQSSGTSYSTHNNNNFNNPCVHTFVNNTFIGGGSKACFKATSLASGVVSKITFKGNSFGSYLTFDGVDVEYEITGYGNNVVPIDVDNSSLNEFTYLFNEESSLLKNTSGGTMSIGTPIKLNELGRGVRFMANGDSMDLFAGISFNSGVDDATIVIKEKGFFMISKTPLTGTSIGDRIGVVNGVLEIVTGDNYIGIVVLNDFIKLKNYI